jgi:hypothetical protein
MQETSRGPTRQGYLWSGIIFLIGIVGTVALAAVFFFGLTGLADDLDRMVAPGQEQVELDDTGTWVLFYEYESRIDGVSYSSQRNPPPMDIEITRVFDGESIPVQTARGESTYSLRHHSGEAIHHFSIDEPGLYELSISYVDEDREGEFVIAYGEGIGRTLLTSIGAFLGAGLVFCLMSVLAIAIAGITFYRRYQAGRPPPS